nr:hypothetical protein CFP56_16822 [Quercus suber]
MHFFVVFSMTVGIAIATPPTSLITTTTATLAPEVAKRGCVTSMLYGGQVPVTVTKCSGGSTTKCSVCVGCNAPVTVCKTS